MDGHDDLLRQHQQKMDQHRRWMQEQHQALRGSNAGSAAPGPYTTPATTSSYPEAARSEAQYSSNMYASAKSTQGGSSPAPYVPMNSGHSAAATPLSTARPSQQRGGNGLTPRRENDGSYASQQQPQPFSVVRRGPVGEAPRHDVLCNDEHFVSVNSGSPIAVFMRGTQWAKRREQRLEEQRVAKLRDEMVDCTFSPTCDATTSSLSSARGGAHHNNGDVDDGASPDRGSQQHYSASRRSGGHYAIAEVAPGIHEHLDRQLKARQIAREKEERLFSAGSKWTAEITQVEPFHLGQRIPVGTIRALHQPIQAPHRSLLDIGGVYQPYTTSTESPVRGGGADEGSASIPPPGHFSRFAGPNHRRPTAA